MKISLILTLFILLGCDESRLSENRSETIATLDNQNTMNDSLEIATFANGCFWCTEAVFQRVEGVEKVVSGYLGGKSVRPTYEEVCTGTTGHAEACQLYFNPSVISYRQLLEIFWQTHDPTTLNRQGNDVGTQYRSAVFYHNDEQRKAAEEVVKVAQTWWDNPIVTEITPASVFYAAEEYHQDYYNRVGSRNGYCVVVINPKVQKFKKQFKDKLKKGVD